MDRRRSRGKAQSERLPVLSHHLSEAISDEVGAVVEPFSATVRAIVQSGAGPDDNVAIVGTGPIGLMTLIAARIQGVKQVVAIEVTQKRIEEDVERTALEITGGQGFDIVIECAGSPQTILMAGRLARTRGRIIVMGVFEKPAALDLTDIVFREKIVSGSMSGYGMYDVAIRIMSDRRFRGDLLVSDRIGLDELITKGYYGLLREKDQHVKILVRPD
jgi:(R,R)-butanediol dehydrogenase / meso-butanediol dehydrogenase / diacetyl reductase